jgi:hypothetical protein
MPHSSPLNAYVFTHLWMVWRYLRIGLVTFILAIILGFMIATFRAVGVEIASIFILSIGLLSNIIWCVFIIRKEILALNYFSIRLLISHVGIVLCTTAILLYLVVYEISSAVNHNFNFSIALSIWKALTPSFIILLFYYFPKAQFWSSLKKHLIRLLFTDESREAARRNQNDA